MMDTGRHYLSASTLFNFQLGKVFASGRAAGPVVVGANCLETDPYDGVAEGARLYVTASCPYQEVNPFRNDFHLGAILIDSNSNGIVRLFIALVTIKTLAILDQATSWGCVRAAQFRSSRRRARWSWCRADSHNTF